MRKALKRVLLGVLVLILIAVGGFGWMYHGELKSLSSVKRVENTSFFTMEYSGDYGLDEFLRTGAASDAELKEFIMNRLLKGLPIDFELPKLGCSTFSAKLTDGSSVFGRNFDEVECPSMMLITRPKDGYASIKLINALDDQGVKLIEDADGTERMEWAEDNELGPKGTPIDEDSAS